MGNNVDAKLGIISPWVNFYREIQALFDGDPEISIKYNEELNEVRLYVDNPMKAEALTKILPEEKTFGNVTMKILVIPANTETYDPLVILNRAFAGNPALSFTRDETTPLGNMKYAVFAKQVVQYFNDDMSDLFGLRSTLYADIAKDVLNLPGVSFCTDDVYGSIPYNPRQIGR